jgi:hypothetical protein
MKTSGLDQAWANALLAGDGQHELRIRQAEEIPTLQVAISTLSVA